MNPEIILGPPGCGKTTRLLEIVDDCLSRGVEPDAIGYFSFTRRAAEEAVTRACEKFSLRADDLPHFRTLHSHCFRSLGLRRQDVMEGKRLKEFAQYAGVRVTGRWAEDGSFAGFEDGDRILFMENLARVRCLPLRAQYDADDDALPWQLVQRVSDDLHRYKEKEGLLDYTDMLAEYIRSGPRPQLRHLIIDEAQDLSQLQWRVAAELARGCENIVVAGDDDQAIYPWAGADVSHFVSMPGTTRVLRQSWRVPMVVQQLATRIIDTVAHRRQKEWSPRQGVEGTLARAVDFDAVNLDADEETLVLTRNIYLLREQVIPTLRRRGIIYEYNGAPSISLKVRNAITWWERLRRGETVTVEQARSVYEHISSGRGITRGFKQLPAADESTEVTMEWLRQHGGLLADGPWYEALDRLPVDDVEYLRSALAQGHRLAASPRVRISTIHGSKGGQADHVVLLREMARRTWREYERNPDDEARVWYVGATRARSKLTLVSAEVAQEYPI